MKPRPLEPTTSWRDDGATKLCPICQHPFPAVGRGKYCGDSCRKKAWRMRHQSLAVPVVVPAPGVPRRSVTVYACQGCGARAVGVQRCEDCGSFMTRVGLGGECPACSEPVAVCELLDDALVVSGQPATSPTTAIPADRTRPSERGARR
jgi:hypothetical protein